MRFDCGHIAESGHGTSEGFLCLSCIDALQAIGCLSPGVSSLEKAKRQIKKRLPEGWPEEKVARIASRLVQEESPGVKSIHSGADFKTEE